MTTRFVTPFELWGRDHYSTLGYLRHRVTSDDGKVDDRQMRAGSAYPTRLDDGTERTPHDDYGCAVDFIAYGLIRIEGDDELAADPDRWHRNPSRRLHRLTVKNAVRYRSTPLGMHVFQSHLEYEADHGGQHSSFRIKGSAAFMARLRRPSAAFLWAADVAPSNAA